MRKFKGFQYLAVLILTTAICHTINAQPAETKPTPTRIACIDLTRVFDQSARREGLEKAISERQKELAKEEETRMNVIERMTGEIESYVMGTPQRIKLEKERKTTIQALEEWRQKSVAEMDAKVADGLITLYDETTKVTAQVAQELGFDMVIKDQSIEEKPESLAEAAKAFADRIVIYAKPEYDLTTEVIQKMNERYAAEQKESNTNVPE